MKQYPIYHTRHIVQYDENVFVWLDETENACGVETTLEAAQEAQYLYFDFILGDR